MAGSAKLSFDFKVLIAKFGGVATCSYEKNHIIYAQGSAADEVFYIQKGKIKLSVVSALGEERVLAILDAGDLCGETCLMDHLPRVSTATTITECAVVKLQKAVVVRALHEDPSFSDFFVSYLLARNVRLNEDLIDQLFNSSEQRLARVLLLLANYAEDQQEVVLPDINQQTLAKMIGTTRSRVNYFMNKFRRMGFIDYNGHVKVRRTLLQVVPHHQPHK